VLDSPGTASEVTYRVRGWRTSGSGALTLNTPAYGGTLVKSGFTFMEIKA
jgi:hypothetical protein